MRVKYDLDYSQCNNWNLVLIHRNLNQRQVQWVFWWGICEEDKKWLFLPYISYSARVLFIRSSGWTQRLFVGEKWAVHFFFFCSQFRGKQPNQEYSTAAVIFVVHVIFTKNESFSCLNKLFKRGHVNGYQSLLSNIRDSPWVWRKHNHTYGGTKMYYFSWMKFSC